MSSENEDTPKAQNSADEQKADQSNQTHADNPPKSAPASVTQNTTQSKLNKKIQIILKPAGGTKALKQQKWMVTRDRTVGGICQFLKTQLKVELESTLFLYVKQTFSPSADVTLGTLYDCFGSEGRLVFHYSTTESWG